MKQLIIIFFLFIEFLSAQEYKQKLANDICDCFDEKKSKEISQDEKFLDCYKEKAIKYKDSMNLSFDKSITYDPVKFAEAYNTGEKQLKEIRDLLSNKCSSFIRMSEEAKKTDKKFLQKISNTICKCLERDTTKASLLKRVEICYKDYESKHLDEIKLYLSKRSGFQVRKVKKYSLEMLSKVYAMTIKDCKLLSHLPDINDVKKDLVKQTCDCITTKKEEISNSKIHVDCYQEVLDKNKSNIESVLVLEHMLAINNSKLKKITDTFLFDTQTELLNQCDPFLQSFDHSNMIVLDNLRKKASQQTMDSLDLEIKSKSLGNTFWARGIRYLALGDYKRAEYDLLKALEMSSNKVNTLQAQFFLGWCYESQKKYKKAVTMFQEAYTSTNKKMFLLRLESAKSKVNKINNKI